MSNGIEKILMRVDQRDLNLVGTKGCIQMVRDAKESNCLPELQQALFQLARMTAVMEWGAGTEIDDFSEPGKFIVSNGKKLKLL